MDASGKWKGIGGIGGGLGEYVPEARLPGEPHLY